MAEESFLMVSLEEEKSKKLAQVLSNDTSRKILDLLSKNDMMTETEIAKELEIPLSTAHYNLGLLVDTDLINDDHYTYSKKGKKIRHFQLSNKYVVIAPKKSSKIFDKLKDFLPVALVSGLAAAGIKYLWKPGEAMADAAPRMLAAVEEKAVEDAAVFAAEVQPVLSNQDFALWFLAGSVFAIILTFVWISWIRKK